MEIRFASRRLTRVGRPCTRPPSRGNLAYAKALLEPRRGCECPWPRLPGKPHSTARRDKDCNRDDRATPQTRVHASMPGNRSCTGPFCKLPPKVTSEATIELLLVTRSKHRPARSRRAGLRCTPPASFRQIGRRGTRCLLVARASILPDSQRQYANPHCGWARSFQGAFALCFADVKHTSILDRKNFLNETALVDRVRISTTNRLSLLIAHGAQYDWE